MPKPRRLTREEKIQKRENSFKGTGLYIYENNTDGYLTLPKPASDGRKVIPPRGKFNGDSYFMQLVKPPSNLLRFMEEIKEEILGLDINTLTPVEALMKLIEIKRMLTKK
jgi:hypothetical protein